MEHETKSACLPNRFDITVSKFVDLTEMLIFWGRQIVVGIEKPVGLLAKADPTGREIAKFSLVDSLSGLFGPILGRIEAAKPLPRGADAGRVEKELDAPAFSLFKKLFSAFVAASRKLSRAKIAP